MGVGQHGRVRSCVCVCDGGVVALCAVVVVVLKFKKQPCVGGICLNNAFVASARADTIKKKKPPSRRRLKSTTETRR